MSPVDLPSLPFRELTLVSYNTTKHRVTTTTRFCWFLHPGEHFRIRANDYWPVHEAVVHRPRCRKGTFITLFPWLLGNRHRYIADPQVLTEFGAGSAPLKPDAAMVFDILDPDRATVLDLFLVDQLA